MFWVTVSEMHCVSTEDNGCTGLMKEGMSLKSNGVLKGIVGG
jgi:hypothetical protein